MPKNFLHKIRLVSHGLAARFKLYEHLCRKLKTTQSTLCNINTENEKMLF